MTNPLPGDDITARISVIVGDITGLPTELGVDCIVNAANESLLGGGGVDGAIHDAAGPRLLEHNKTLGGCATGLAKRTPAFDLEDKGVRHLIHTVGPVWSGQRDTGVPGAPGNETASLGNTREDVLLASCYTQCLALCVSHAVRCAAFPCISTGAYDFPRERAAKIAFGHIHGHLARHDAPNRVVICCFSDEDAAVYRDVIATRADWMLGRKRA